ncbi:beta-ketoacyl synthase domain-containing protein [Aspergillus ellipticus CBS 707.79]|uniref:Beta-ketoacyl synthase domain-containing protein n=1 Tax=Aspergillus ellipticus CBS 707.79 TaxID=1448320 RepID=A0A319E0R0_9EURO|nr:beta-ketoacyl synthase domain-containing protein [Aspergillus ellipticus CBS 707.79]
MMHEPQLQSAKEPIAIIGSGCRFPGAANSPSRLWDLLRQPEDLLREIPTDRFNAKAFHHHDPLYHGHSNVLHSYLLDEDVRRFDAQFFSIKPVEAQSMDPQQRLLLETMYEGVEAAGLTIEGLRGTKAGVYVGLMCNDYEAMLLRDFQQIPNYHATGIARSIMSNRISYFFDWHGPSMTIDTACSSSLIAVHLAVQALRAGDTQVAFACGSNLLLGPENYVAESKLKMLSPNGRSRMWDDEANGYARGEGVAVVVLKTLSQALADGDHIECLIRETGTNQDGRTKGITMPSATAQESLIRDTYARAGLDLRQEGDRCQYFEAHGTGTPAGDPIEAEAINRAFFGHDATASNATTTNPLYVGSIKTVVGHTEGTAGLAAVLKASLALQNGTIPPNMLFNRLNPQVGQFYGLLEIPRIAIPWPETPVGAPRRASVNSFGFGGSNAHAILESYQPLNKVVEPSVAAKSFSPFVFSAKSEQSLVANLQAYTKFLDTNPSMCPQDLAWTLRSRRSKFPVRVTFPASSVDSLRANIEQRLNVEKKGEDGTVGSKSAITSGTAKPRLLGVFTGQGAQYARMGAELIETSQYAATILAGLETQLGQLPESDRPSWSLRKELLADTASSRIHEACISQPLCTAVQIMLVEVLRLAGIRFSTVVGHSSGEIGAAYAAGYISAKDAICIAYYRGLHSQLAHGPNGMPGAMLAVGTTLEDAQDLLSMEEFSGRVTVAASNAPSSVTLSGDKDALDELEVILEDEGKFRRRLKVDKAYHSHHMRWCSEAYLRSLRNCDIQVQQPSSDCTWISSVHENPAVDIPSMLSSRYWDDNMVQPVLFSQAVQRALALGSYDLAIEVGPHPALKGPATQTAQELSSEDILYTGVLSRGKDAVGALSDAMGFLWLHLGTEDVNLDRFDSQMSGRPNRQLVTNLPSYQWQHDRTYWHESRISRQMRQRQHAVHPLLGDLTPDSAQHHMMWRNLLRPTEIAWIRGHQLQNQIVFPAAGYVATALETVPYLVSERDQMQLIEVGEFIIHQAMVFDEDDAGIEVLTSISDICRDDPTRLTAKFTYSAAMGKERDNLTLVASGGLEVILGASSAQTLPSRGPAEPNMIEVETDRFYSALEELGYGYQGPFRALSAITRKLGKASGQVAMTPTEPTEPTLIVHPAMLDAAIQSVILAYSYPNDGQLWSLHVPTQINSIRINPALCGDNWAHVDSVPFEASLVEHHGPGVTGDVDVYGTDGEQVAIQMQGMQAVPFAGATEADDRNIFSTMKWSSAEPVAEHVMAGSSATEEDYELAYLLERISSFYLRRLDEDFAPDHPGRSEHPYSAYFNYATHVNSLVSSGEHPYTKTEWLDDSLEDIMTASQPFAHCPDVRIMHIIGQQMPEVIRGQTTILEHLVPTGLLDDYYVDALGFPQFSLWLARTVGQVTQRYPSMDILEIGAGTGGATKSIFRQIQSDYSSYTFTDISNGFFDKARSIFQEYEDRMVFKVLDVEKDVAGQGFVEKSYDLVVASFVIHATRKLEDTMRNVRRLLKPGGFVIMAEVTNNDQIRGGFIFGALPGWWVGLDEGRVLTPCVPPAKWDGILRRTGFSGIDMITSDNDHLPYPGAVFISQAVDDQVQYLRHPLSPPRKLLGGQSLINDLHIVGGNTLRVSQLTGQLQTLLGPFSDKVTTWEDMETINYDLITAQSTVVVLAELDRPVFQNLTAERFQSLKEMFGSERTVIWVTQGRRADNPFSNMTVGFGRSLLWEVPDLRLQFIDFEDPKIDPRALAEATLRFQAAGEWTNEESNRLVWSTEPEIAINSRGWPLIPRLHLLHEANNRYNSARRPISTVTDPETSLLYITQDSDGSFGVKSESKLASATLDAVSGLMLQLRVTHSMVQSIQTSVGRRSVVLGEDLRHNTHYLALAETPSSVLNVLPQSVVPCVLSKEAAPALIATVAANLFILSVLQAVPPGQTLLAHNSNPMLAHILSRRAKENAVNVVYTTASTDDYICQPSWVKIQRYMPRRKLKSLLPKNVGYFLDLSWDEVESAEAAFIVDCLPSRCLCGRLQSQYSQGSDGAGLYTSHVVRQTLQVALDLSLEGLERLKDPQDTPLIKLADIGAGQKIPQATMTVADWTGSAPLALRVAPVDSTPLFKADSTYWLVGLTGSLGLSLCDWMIDHGARFVVLTSRNPKIDPAWLDLTRSRGAVVKVFANDMTQEQEVKSVYAEIFTTLPPIAGVAQGAMVLRDIPTRDMSHEDMMQTVRPKVETSIHLDALFADIPLDFFIFFSSMTAVIGNMGQANYTAANAFMCALAAQRRSRGLHASVMNIGVIIGAGYVTREVSQADQKNLRKGGYMWMSEADFHQIFAEAIEAGRSTTLSEPEISTGLRQVPADSPYLPIWAENPKFSRFIQRLCGAETQQDTTKAGGASIKDQLLAVRTIQDAQAIISETFAAKLRSILQVEDSTGDLLGRRTDELGLDSLIAVDIRSWFLKHFQVNVPVLKILGGASIADLVQQALGDLPSELIPNLDQKADSADSGSHEEPSPPTSLPIQPPQQATLAQIRADSSSPSPPDTSDQLSQTGSSAPEEGRLTPASSTSGELIKESPISKPKVVIQRSGRLSFAQSMFWFVHALMEDKTTLNHTGMFRFTGNLDRDRLSRAVTAVAHRHEALRTCFVMDENQQITQGVLESPVLHLEQKLVSAEADVMAEYEALKRHVYGLTTGETMRLLLVSSSPRDHYLLIGCHHINVDGISHQVIMADLECAYRGESPEPSLLQYLDHAQKRREEHERGSWANEIAYWTKELETIPKPLPPGRRHHIQRQPLHAYEVHSVKLRVEAPLANRIREVVRTNKTTAFHFYLAAFRTLLHRYLDVKDVCIGIADGNRSDAGMMNSIGPYVNLLPLRFAPREGLRFTDALAEARSKTYAALAHGQLPFEVLLNSLRVVRSPTHSPIFQSFVDYRQGTREKQPFADLQVDMLQFEAGRTAYDLSLDIIDNPGQDALVVLMAQKSLYSASDAELISQVYEDILKEFASSPSLPMDKPWSFRQGALQSALTLGKGPSFNQLWSETLIHQFETMRYLDKTALHIANGPLVTYRQLGQRVDSIASELIGCGVQPGSRVAVFQDRTSDWIASMLATMKSGAVYVPLDPSIPSDRLAMMVKDCQPIVMLTDDTTTSEGASLAQTCAAVRVNVSALPNQSSFPLPNQAMTDSTALILYTSGTTGAPKGIALPHSSFCHEVEVSVATYGLSENDYILQQSAFGFDMSALQVFLAVAQGATLCMTSAAMRADPSAISSFIEESGVTYTCATPSEYQSWLQPGPRLAILRKSAWRVALTGGEPATANLLDSFRDLGKGDLRLFNGYGPTETTCCSTKMELSYQNPEVYLNGIPAGYPSPNEAIYIVDEKMRLQPLGQPGEIVIGGVGVASGYLNNVALTKTAFLPDAFASAEYTSKGWRTMYRTKDYGHLQQDGALIIEGRVDADTEIKLNGVRVDLRDIENTTLQAAGGVLRNVAVSVRSAGDRPFLVAHCAFTSSELSTTERNTFLQGLLTRLPLSLSMRPSALVAIDQMPLTSAGKLDRRALAQIALPTRVTLDEAIPTPVLAEAEMHMKTLWEEVIPSDLLSQHQIEKDTDFFHVGGSSMLLVELQTRMSEGLQTPIPLIQLFESSTLEAMALLIAKSSDAAGVKSNSIDWEAETRLAPALQPVPASLQYSGRQSPPKMVILTGASGFLGKHILDHLLKQPSVSKIICIAVRQLNQKAHLFAGLDRKRVVFYEGDLSAPRLGLTEAEAQQIFGIADAVIHNGADVSHLKNYHTLKLANVESTQQLVQLCLPRAIAIHYVSTAGAAMFIPREVFPEASARDASPPTDGSDGYTATKWASEVYLEQANTHLHLPVWIHRPSSVVREEAPDNSPEKPMFDLLQNLLRFSRRLRAVPMSTNLQGSLDLVSVDNVTRGIVNAVMTPRQITWGNTGNAKVVYAHLTGDLDLPIAGLKDYLEKETGERFITIPIAEWARRAEEMGLHRAVTTAFANVERMGVLRFPRFGSVVGRGVMAGGDGANAHLVDLRR